METLWIVYLVLFIVFLQLKKTENINVVRKHLRNKRGIKNMTELIEKYIGKECLIYTCTSGTAVTGVVRCCKDNWLEIEKNGEYDIINCEYITRIREYPRNKNGKKKSFIAD